MQHIWYGNPSEGVLGPKGVETHRFRTKCFRVIEARPVINWEGNFIQPRFSCNTISGCPQETHCHLLQPLLSPEYLKESWRSVRHSSHEAGFITSRQTNILLVPLLKIPLLGVDVHTCHPSTLKANGGVPHKSTWATYSEILFKITAQIMGVGCSSVECLLGILEALGYNLSAKYPAMGNTPIPLHLGGGIGRVRRLRLFLSI